MSISSSAQIHETAVIENGATIGEGVVVGPYAVIGANVVLGARTRVDSHVVLAGRTKIGEGNHIFPFASVGTAPQDLKYRGEESELIVGNENVIREYVTLQPGTSGGGMKTTIGNSNLLMACTHVGHDCHLGNGNILANSAALSGHVIVGDSVTVGGLSGIHQFVRLGNSSFIGGGAMVVQDIPPYCLAQGDRAKLCGLNLVGLKRQGFSADDIRELKSCYREIFLRSGKLRDKLEEVVSKYAGKSHIETLVSFIKSSERGVTSARSEDDRDRSGDSEQKNGTAQE
ncbi:MAG: acyl-ACP--UDP-N-acetylglucosamine O-acyltransferase [Bdellovibrionales bacterium]|nr:acyl-ACP--UDP-N-acetylglucosamine O-acyltransferase [Bdellovibrionales bacterium]